MAPNFGLPPLAMQPFGATPQQDDPTKPSAEALARMFMPYDKKQALLQQQMAQAEALRANTGGRHSTGIGGLFGALASGINGANGGYQASQLGRQQTALDQQQAQAGAERFGLTEALKRQADEREMAFKKGLHDDEMGAKKQAHGDALRAAAEKAKKDAEKDSADKTTGLRKEFNQLPEVKAFRDVDVSFEKMKNSAAKPTAAGDLALIFSFMKMLDPGSSVKDQEFANAQNAAGVPDRVQNAWNNALKGQRLNPEQRAEFMAEAGNFHGAHAKQYNAAAQRYRGLAGDGADQVISLGGAPQQVVSAAGLDVGGGAVKSAGGPVKIATDVDWAALAPGTEFIDPEGNRRRK